MVPREPGGGLTRAPGDTPTYPMGTGTLGSILAGLVNRALQGQSVVNKALQGQYRGQRGQTSQY